MYIALHQDTLLYLWSVIFVSRRWFWHWYSHASHPIFASLKIEYTQGTTRLSCHSYVYKFIGSKHFHYLWHLYCHNINLCNRVLKSEWGNKCVYYDKVKTKRMHRVTNAVVLMRTETFHFQGWTLISTMII